MHAIARTLDELIEMIEMIEMIEGEREAERLVAIGVTLAPPADETPSRS